MECPICFEDKTDIYKCEECTECICTDCKTVWNKDCPYCRATYIPPTSARVNIPVINQPSAPLLLNYLPEPVRSEQPSPRQVVGMLVLFGIFVCGMLKYNI